MLSTKNTIKKRFIILFLLIFSLQNSAFCFTLEVSGKIKNHTDNENKTYVLSEADILSMPVHAITTATSWTPKKKFEGVSLAEILQKVGVLGNKMTIYG